MKNLVYLCIFLMIAAINLYSQNMGPESVDLKEKYAPESQMPSVHFPHWTHQAFIDCQICHTSSGALKDWRRWTSFDIKYPAEFHTAFCGYCHDVVAEEGSQNTCVFCHRSGE